MIIGLIVKVIIVTASIPIITIISPVVILFSLVWEIVQDNKLDT